MLRIDGFYIFDPWEGPEPGQYFVNVEKKKKKKNRPVETKSHAAFCNVSLCCGRSSLYIRHISCCVSTMELFGRLARSSDGVREGE